MVGWIVPSKDVHTPVLEPVTMYTTRQRGVKAADRVEVLASRLWHRERTQVDSERRDGT